MSGGAAQPGTPAVAAARRVLRPPRGLTALELDPLAAISARGFLVVVAVVSLVCAIGLTVTTADQISSWPLAVLALVLLAAGYGWFVRSAFRFDLGVSNDRFAVSYALVAIATVLNSLSCLGTNTLVRDDWGLVTIGLVLMAAAPFRTSAELGTYTTVSVALAGMLAGLHWFTSLDTSIPLAVIVLVAAAPALALGLGSVGYARHLLLGIYAERLDQAENRERQFDELRRTFVDDDVVGSIGSLREEIVPFLARIRQSGTLTVDDRVRAGVLAQTLQGAIAEARRSDSLADHVSALVDEAGLSPRLHEDDRATLRALLIALNNSEHASRQGITLELVEGEDDRFGVVRCRSDDVRALRADVLPFIRMARLMFRRAGEQVTDDTLLVQFDIDRLA
ncbi:hypothetical protein [Herbiconiux ginsengi]|uniref:Uncharacterized protein n=1 Tax=Herbiconiux ginsengi TaxID=381665 RepID=A0A1H3U739_9MICO|nr:hypothetical protein [Herbiconiux ginsengi]SDZ57615.1 hypothetical protein SAMN05216554_0150 [Herbiconiux ginsengi]